MEPAADQLLKEPTLAERTEYLALLKQKLPSEIYEAIERFVSEPEPSSSSIDPAGVRIFM